MLTLPVTGCAIYQKAMDSSIDIEMRLDAPERGRRRALAESRARLRPLLPVREGRRRSFKILVSQATYVNVT